MNLKINLNVIKPYIDDEQIDEPSTEDSSSVHAKFAMYLINLQYQQTINNLYQHLQQIQHIDYEYLAQLKSSIECVIQYFIDLQQDLQSHM
jgi:hypothetical protein